MFRQISVPTYSFVVQKEHDCFKPDSFDKWKWNKLSEVAAFLNVNPATAWEAIFPSGYDHMFVVSEDLQETVPVRERILWSFRNMEACLYYGRRIEVRGFKEQVLKGNVYLPNPLVNTVFEKVCTMEWHVTRSAI